MESAAEVSNEKNLDMKRVKLQFDHHHILKGWIKENSPIGKVRF